MHIRILLVISVLTVSGVLSSCSKENESSHENVITGIWVYRSYADNAYIYLRSREFADNHCFRFNSDGSLIERKNAGWCGTPPVTYANYEGTWSYINDTIINVESGYWGGKTTYRIDLESVSPDSIAIQFIYNEK